MVSPDKLTVIDFDAPMQAFIMDWVKRNRERYKDADELELHVPEAYTLFNNTEQPFLDGARPGFYFHAFSGAELVELLKAYAARDVAAPEQLLVRVVELKGETERLLMDILPEARFPAALRMLVVELLNQQGSLLPMDSYFEWLAAASEDDELLDAAAEALRNMETDSGAFVERALKTFDAAPLRGRARVAELLLKRRGDDRVYKRLMRQFMEDADNIALNASYLAQYGDDRALPALRLTLGDNTLNYLDYIEVRNAIEALGGEVEDERNFEGDVYYESLKGL